MPAPLLNVIARFRLWTFVLAMLSSAFFALDGRSDELVGERNRVFAVQGTLNDGKPFSIKVVSQDFELRSKADYSVITENLSLLLQNYKGPLGIIYLDFDEIDIGRGPDAAGDLRKAIDDAAGESADRVEVLNAIKTVKPGFLAEFKKSIQNSRVPATREKINQTLVQVVIGTFTTTFSLFKKYPDMPVAQRLGYIVADAALKNFNGRQSEFFTRLFKYNGDLQRIKDDRSNPKLLEFAYRYVMDYSFNFLFSLGLYGAYEVKSNGTQIFRASPLTEVGQVELLTYSLRTSYSGFLASHTYEAIRKLIEEKQRPIIHAELEPVFEEFTRDADSFEKILTVFANQEGSKPFSSLLKRYRDSHPAHGRKSFSTGVEYGKFVHEFEELVLQRALDIASSNGKLEYQAMYSTFKVVFQTLDFMHFFTGELTVILFEPKVSTMVSLSFFTIVNTVYMFNPEMALRHARRWEPINRAIVDGSQNVLDRLKSAWSFFSKKRKALPAVCATPLIEENIENQVYDRILKILKTPRRSVE
jgi:hypothetical protein